MTFKIGRAPCALALPHIGVPPREDMEAQTNVHTEKKPPEGNYTTAACCHHGYSRPAAAGTKIAARNGHFATF